MPAQKIVSIKRLQRERTAANKERINLHFTIDPKTPTGRAFMLALHHYGGEQLILDSTWPSAIAKAMLQAWLDEHVKFPRIELSEG